MPSRHEGKCAGPLAAASAVLVLCLVAAQPGLAQVPAQIARAVMAREGALIPIGETETFTPSDAKAVCWVQVVPTFTDRTIQFRWVTPGGSEYRLSPVLPLVPGDEITWDQILIRGAPAERLSGTWRVDILVDGQLASTIYFRLVTPTVRPFNVRSETSLNLRAQHTWRRTGGDEILYWNAIDQRIEILSRVRERDFSLKLSRGLTGGNAAEEARGSIVALLSGAGYSIAAGREWGDALNPLTFDRPTVSGITEFIDLRYARETFGAALLLSRQDRIDNLDPRAIDDTIVVTTATLAYSHRPWTASLAYARTTLEDRTGGPFTAVTTTSGSLVYSPFPSRFVFLGTHVRTVSFTGATAFSTPLTLTTTNTILRGLYFAASGVTIGATYGFGESGRADGSFDSRTSLIGGDVVWRISSRSSLRGAYQVQNVDSRTGVTTSQTMTSTVSGALEFRPRSDLFLSVIYTPVRVEATGGFSTAISTLTGVLAYFPSSRFSLSATYSRVLTGGVAPVESGFGTFNARYDIRTNLRLVAAAQTTALRFAAFPTSDLDRLFYSVVLTWQR
jgi:hypothetical protein